MKTCALLTCENLENFVHDEHLLEEALMDAGWMYQWVQWKDQDVKWDNFDCAIVRTTWDYTEDPKLFLKQLKRIDDSTCRLYNDYSLIQWNWQKKYLKEMQSWGLPVIPTLWMDSFKNIELKETYKELGCKEVVIKPQVGAGAKNTFRMSADIDFELSTLEGQAVMVQPFQKNVEEEGEYSCHFYNGLHSHSILKKPKAGDYRSQEEYGSYIEEVAIPKDIEIICQDIFEKLPLQPLFARVDFIYDSERKPQIIELELIEPSLYFRMSEGSANKLVDALNKRF